MSAYRYGLNAPTSFVDRDGRVAESPMDVTLFGLSIYIFGAEPGVVTGIAVVADGIAVFVPIVPAFGGISIRALFGVGDKVGDTVGMVNRVGRLGDDAAEAGATATKAAPPAGAIDPVEVVKPYKRPSGSTTPEQRASVQGQPCVDCGVVTPKQYADHKTPLVKEYYETGKIDVDKMRSVDAVQPQCPGCSNRQGAEMRKYSVEKKEELNLK
jgi:hypothetical protein